MHGTDFQTERGKEYLLMKYLMISCIHQTCFGCGEQELMSLEIKMKDLMYKLYMHTIITYHCFKHFADCIQSGNRFGICRDLIAELWMNHQAYRGEVRLKVICGESFGIMKDTCI